MPAGAHHVRQGEQARDEVVRRHLGGRHQGAIGLRDPDRLGLTAVVAAAVLAGGLNPAGSAGRCCRSEEAADHELAWVHRRDVGADLLDDAAVLMADRAAAC